MVGSFRGARPCLFVSWIRGIVGFFCGPDPVFSFFCFFLGGGHCWILSWTIFFRGQSPVDEANFCRVGRAIVSSGIVGMDLVICVSDSFVGQSLSILLFLDLKHS